MLRDAVTRWMPAAEGRGPGDLGCEITPSRASWSIVELESILVTWATGIPRWVTSTSAPFRARSIQWLRRARNSAAETSMGQAYVSVEAEPGEFTGRAPYAAMRDSARRKVNLPVDGCIGR